jgi:ATP-binding cassette subfamily B protein
MDMASPTHRRIETGKRILGAFSHYFWLQKSNSRGVVFFVFLTILAGKGFNLIAPFFYKSAVDALNPSGADIAAIVPLAVILAYGGSRLAEQFSTFLRGAVLEPFLARRINEIRCDFFEHLHSLSIRFHLDRQTGGLSLSLLRGVNAMRAVFENIFFSILPIVIEFSFVCITLTGLYDIRYLILMLIASVVYLQITIWVTKKNDAFQRQSNMAFDRASTHTVDSLLNFETVKYFAKEAHEVQRYRENHETLQIASLKTASRGQGLSLIQGMLIVSAATIGMIMAAQDVLAGRIKVGDFVLVNTYLLQLFVPLGSIGGLYARTKASIIDMEDMLAVLDLSPEVFDLPSAPALNLIRGDVSFDSVRFGYDQDHEILKGISFHIPAGKRMAIVGTTGAGKSTISKLLFRLYDPWSGAIRIDGQNIKDVTQKSLRAVFGVIPQDTVLFNDTIYYNIAYGSMADEVAPTHAEIVHAAKLARLHDFVVTLPQGYETRVGERGLKLSGGEKQRVAIARAILRKPRILLLDEATSSLDNNTEAEIQDCLQNVTAHCTTFVIAHRLSTIVDADEIIVLDAGEIVERGNHHELLAKMGRYARMWHAEKITEPVEAVV